MTKHCSSIYLTKIVFFSGTKMSTSGQKSRTKRNKIITSKWRSIIKKNSSRQKKIKTLSQEEVINLGNHLKLNDSQRNLLNSLNTKNDNNTIRQNLFVLEKLKNKSSNPNSLISLRNLEMDNFVKV